MEVLKAASALYGASAVGGVVNIITRGVVRAAVGSFNIGGGGSFGDDPFGYAWRRPGYGATDQPGWRHPDVHRPRGGEKYLTVTSLRLRPAAYRANLPDRAYHRRQHRFPRTSTMRRDRSFIRKAARRRVPTASAAMSG